MQKFQQLIVEEEGQSLVEYGLILGLVSVMLVVALKSLQGGLTEIFGKVEKELTGAAKGGGKAGGK